MATKGVSTILKIPSNFVSSLLDSIKKESRKDYEEMQQTFAFLEWDDLPDKLKIEIFEDVKFIVQERKGSFSSHDPFVRQRRESVYFWVNRFRDGFCSLDTAIKALRVDPL